MTSSPPEEELRRLQDEEVELLKDRDILIRKLVENENQYRNTLRYIKNLHDDMGTPYDQR